MVRGGRVSDFKGFIANLLNINPIVSVDANGKAIVFDKAFNQKANMEKVMGHIKRLTGSRKVWNYIVLHATEILMLLTGIPQKWKHCLIKNRYR